MQYIFSKITFSFAVLSLALGFGAYVAQGAVTYSPTSNGNCQPYLDGSSVNISLPTQRGGVSDGIVEAGSKTSTSETVYRNSQGAQVASVNKGTLRWINSGSPNYCDGTIREISSSVTPNTLSAGSTTNITIEMTYEITSRYGAVTQGTARATLGVFSIQAASQPSPTPTPTASPSPTSAGFTITGRASCTDATASARSFIAINTPGGNLGDYYVIYRDGVEIGRTERTTILTYIDYPPQENTAYQYFARKYNSQNQSLGASNTITVTSVPCPPPVTLQNLTVTATPLCVAGSSQVKLDWNQVTGIAPTDGPNFRVTRNSSTWSSSGGMFAFDQNNQQITSWTDTTGMFGGERYEYVVSVTKSINGIQVEVARGSTVVAPEACGPVLANGSYTSKAFTYPPAPTGKTWQVTEITIDGERIPSGGGITYQLCWGESFAQCTAQQSSVPNTEPGYERMRMADFRSIAPPAGEPFRLKINFSRGTNIYATPNLWSVFVKYAQVDAVVPSPTPTPTQTETPTVSPTPTITLTPTPSPAGKLTLTNLNTACEENSQSQLVPAVGFAVNFTDDAFLTETTPPKRFQYLRDGQEFSPITTSTKSYKPEYVIDRDILAGEQHQYQVKIINIQNPDEVFYESNTLTAAAQACAVSPSPTPTPTPTETPTVSPTPTPVETPTPNPSPTATELPTHSPNPTVQITQTPTTALPSPVASTSPTVQATGSSVPTTPVQTSTTTPPQAEVKQSAGSPDKVTVEVTGATVGENIDVLVDGAEVTSVTATSTKQTIDVALPDASKNTSLTLRTDSWTKDLPLPKQLVSTGAPAMPWKALILVISGVLLLGILAIFAKRKTS